MTRYFTLTFILLFVIMYGCTDNSVSNEETIVIETDDFRFTNDEAEIESRFSDTEISVPIDTNTSQLFKASTFRSAKPRFKLTQIASMSSPLVNGNPLQSTMVYTDGSTRTMISYNFRGSPYLGGVDIAQITGNGKRIRPRSALFFFNADANAIHYTNNDLYVSVGTNAQNVINSGGRSAVLQFSLNGFNLASNIYRYSAMPSFAGTSVRFFDQKIYATSGNTGGLSIFDRFLSELLAFIPIEDARWVDVNSEYIVVLAGDTDSDGQGSILIYDTSTYSLVNEFPFTGAYTAEAKNTVQVVNHLAIIAAGREGTHIMDISNGNILSTIPLPDPNSLGLSPEVVATNAVSVDEDKIFISNGEAGVYVAELNRRISDYREGQSVNVSLIGRLQLDELESVNHITYRNKFLIVAAGRGGTKTILLK